jgi:hypothetical protein
MMQSDRSHVDSAERARAATRTFFERLPVLALSRIERFASTTGTIVFVVDDVGAWTFRMGNLEAPVAAGIAADRGLTLYFSALAFESFIAGAADVGALARDGGLHASGDLGLLERFGLFLQPPKSALSWRLGG